MELIASFLAPRSENRRVSAPRMELEVGREPSCGLLLDHPSVSRRHARITVLPGASHFIVEDCGSANGTFVEGVPVKARVPVHPDQVVEVGPYRFRICRHADGGDAGPTAVPEGNVQDDEVVHRAVESLPALMNERAKPGQDGTQFAKAAEDALCTRLLEILPPRTDPARIQRLTARAMTFALGLGPLEGWLKDPSITEIMINGVDSVFLEREGRLCKTASVFPTEGSLMRVVERILSPLGRRVDETCPFADGRLPDGSRLHVVVPPISLAGPVVTIRKFADRGLDCVSLVRMGALSAEAAALLEAAVRQRRNILVSGGTGTGKTTLLNILAGFIPAGDRIVTIEDAAELRLHQDHVVRLETRPPNVEGRGEVTTRDLVRTCLRMRPDRIVVGECRGGEAIDMLQAMNTGHEGSLTTCHANTPRDALRRIETMALMSGLDLPHRVIREQVAGAIHLIVHLARMSDGARVVHSVVEVDRMEGDQILTQPLFERKGEGGNRRLLPTGLTPLGIGPTVPREDPSWKRS